MPSSKAAASAAAIPAQQRRAGSPERIVTDQTMTKDGKRKLKNPNVSQSKHGGHTAHSP